VLSETAQGGALRAYRMAHGVLPTAPKTTYAAAGKSAKQLAAALGVT